MSARPWKMASFGMFYWIQNKIKTKTNAAMIFCQKSLLIYYPGILFKKTDNRKWNIFALMVKK